MNISAEHYPRARAYVTVWKRAKSAAAEMPALSVQAFTGWFPERADHAYAKFLDALHARINQRGGVQFVGRKHDSIYQTEQARDCRAIRDNATKRIIVRQLVTPELRRRFAHILWTED